MRVESESRQILQRIDNHARETRQRTLNTLGVMRYLVGSMAGLPEPKAMLYLSDGLEMRAAETLFLAHYDRFSEISEALEFDVPLDPPQATIEEYDLSKEFTEFAKNAQTAGVTFFAIDASGQTDTLGGRPSSRCATSDRRGRRVIGRCGTSGSTSSVSRTARARSGSSPTKPAARCWPTPATTTPSSRTCAPSLDNYYSLGFQAPHDREGRRHQIEVRVRQPGLKVSHQRAYVDKSWEARLSEQTVTTLILGAPMGDMTVQAIPGKPTPQDKKFIVPIQILVPVGALGLVPDGKTHVANLSLTVVTKDAKGNTKPAQAMELRLRLTDEQLKTDGQRRSEHPAAARRRSRSRSASASAIAPAAIPRPPHSRSTLEAEVSTAQWSYEAWDRLLREVTSTDGRIDYDRLLEHRALLDQFTAQLAAASPDNRPELFPTSDDALAYWINAYNAFTLAAIAGRVPDHLGVEDARRPFFQRRRHTAGGRAVSLDDVEHTILRAGFREPRIHFAINCGSNGCPPMRPEAYRGEGLDDTLRRATAAASSPASGTAGSTTRRGASTSRASSRCTRRTSRARRARTTTTAAASCASSPITPGSRSSPSKTTRWSTTSTTGA